MSHISSVSSGNSQWPDFAQIQTNLFSQADSDGDGAINQDELKTLMDKNPRLAKDLTALAKGTTGTTAGLDDVFKKLDSDGDGKISAAELKAGLTAARTASQPDLGTGSPPPPRDFSEVLQNIFKEGDGDGDGSISQSELTSMMKKNPGLTRDLASLVSSGDGTNSNPSDSISDIYSKLDTNGDGQVSADEFTTVVTKAHDALMQQLSTSAQTGSTTTSDDAAQTDATQRVLIELLQKLQQDQSAYTQDGTVNSATSQTATFQATA